MSTCYQLGLIILGCTILWGCSSSLDPDALPYRLEKVQELSPNAYPADLNGDGRDELAYIHAPTNGPPGIHAVWIRTQDGQTIEQVNYEGRILPLHFLNVTGDDRPEILVPYVRNDSLFLSVLDGQGRKQFGFFLIDGKPRQEPDGTFPWDPSVRSFHVADVDSNGEDELVTVVFTAFARLPRGILIHHLPDGQPAGRKIIGAAPAKSYLDDFDGDGTSEMVIVTFAPNNGAQAGGFDDQHSYLIAFELGANPEVTWSKTVAANWSGANLAYADFDSDGRREFLSVAISASADPKQAEFEFLEPGTWRTLRKRTFSEPLRWAPLIDLNRDTRPEIITLRGQNEVWVLDQRLQVTRRRTFEMTLNWMEARPDIDGDGIDELIAHLPSRKTILLLDPDLHVKAAFSTDTESRLKIQGVLRRGLGTSPHLLITYLDGNHPSTALRMVENRLYWFYRYGPPVLWGFGLLAVVGLIVGGRHLYRRNRLLDRLQTVAFETAQEGMIVIDPDGKIVAVNPILQNGLDLASHQTEGKPYDEVLDDPPAMLTFLRRAFTTDPPRHHEDTFTLALGDQTCAWRVIVEPVLSERTPYWLLVFRRESQTTDPVDAKTWAMMARKVTHDIKNPLTNILLTTQRLQSEYRKRTPEAADAFDPYADRIVDRVTHLRKLTKQFMKILDVDALDLVKTDPATLVRDVAESVEPDLPPDIDLVLDVHSGLPGVWLDRDQIRTVVENLVANAIHALPEGGTITLATYRVPDLRSAHTDYKPADYVVIEVQDNGVGVAPEDRSRLFEPGFTTSEFGTGLGLALVKHAVEHHDGFMEVESKPDVGSIFTLHLPVADPKST